MRIAIRNHADFLSGLIFIGIGAVFVCASGLYDFGTPLRMGSGFFPKILAWILVLIGAVVLLRALSLKGEPIRGFAWRALVLVTGSAVLFGALVDGAGVVVAVVATIVVASLASVFFDWKRTALMAVILAVFSVAVFVKGLGVAMPILGLWLVD